MLAIRFYYFEAIYQSKQFTYLHIFCFNRDESSFDVPLITKPLELAGLTYIEALNQMTWTETLKSQLQSIVRDTHQIASCIPPKDGSDIVTSNYSTYPDIEFEYVPIDQCDLTKTNV